MNYTIDNYLLRRPEASDLEALYLQKNDPDIAEQLGGFSAGYATADIKDWLEYHRQRKDEVIWAIVEREAKKCVGHVGLYKIDYRVRSAEFAIMIGDKTAQGKGLGRACTSFAMKYAFEELNINRFELTVLSTNQRAASLYRSLGMTLEGTMRQAQYKKGCYVDVLMMSILRTEYFSNDPRR